MCVGEGGWQGRVGRFMGGVETALLHTGGEGGGEGKIQVGRKMKRPGLHRGVKGQASHSHQSFRSGLRTASGHQR